MMGFRDRSDAGRQLAHELRGYEGREEVIVLALPRGGVPVAYEVATALGAPLDVFVVRKLGLPGQPELALGAIASGGVGVLNEEILAHLPHARQIVDSVTATEQRELVRRETAYREGRPPLTIEGRMVILIDDGIATGATIKAAVLALRRRQPARLIVAVPVASVETCQELRAEVDELVCTIPATNFFAVGQWYADFSQTTDEEVRALLGQAAQRHSLQKTRS